MEQKLTSDPGVSRIGGGISKQETRIMAKFFKRMLTAYILSAGAYRHPMMWPH
ncbi:hypothetical protein [Croceibacterium mercuriale]|uniref:hypothetical protein n=1 Tax=Croceibacterium mercuriale TaxID=1572751 RepID=UPI001379333D|nr:hypothetical protein [Croceibacterium mercuriale]